MSWFKVSDKVHSHPDVLMPLELEDEAEQLGMSPFMLANAVLGLVTRCVSLSASRERTHVLHAEALGVANGLECRPLIDIATQCGYWEPIVTPEGKKAYQLPQRNGIFEITTRESRAWEAQRTKDRNDLHLSTTIRLRDGDECRWCGRTVVWLDRKSPRGGTYDHLVPGEAATVDTYVVACRRCNSARNDLRNGWEVQLRPVPEHPVYGLATVEFLARHGIKVTETTHGTD